MGRPNVPARVAGHDGIATGTSLNFSAWPAAPLAAMAVIHGNRPLPDLV
jgi:hypothetical protein